MRELVDLLVDLDAAGIEQLTVIDGKLRFRPVERMTPDLLRRLREHKAPLLAHLPGGARLPEEPVLDGDGWPAGSYTPEPCAACGALERWQDAIGAWHCQTCDQAGLDRSLRLVEAVNQLRDYYRGRSAD